MQNVLVSKIILIMKQIRIFILIIASIAIVQGCAIKPRESKELVSATILPQKFFIDKISNGNLAVNVMIPPGESHATYSPTARQFQEMSDSKLYVSMGYIGYEQIWMSRLKELNGEMNTLSLSDKIELITGIEDHGDHVHEGGIDPHVWMSPKSALKFMPILKDALIKSFPHQKDSFEINYASFEKELIELDLLATEKLTNLKNKQFLIFHPALTYMARDYGLTQVSIEQEGKEPSPAFLASVIEKAKNDNIPVIFIQQEYDVRNAQLVSKEAGIHLVQINPMNYEWLESMKEIINLLDRYLNE